jgi:hypothetical protein
MQPIPEIETVAGGCTVSSSSSAHRQFQARVAAASAHHQFEKSAMAGYGPNESGKLTCPVFIIELDGEVFRSEEMWTAR